MKRNRHGIKKSDFCRDQLMEAFEFNMNNFMQKEMRVRWENYL